MFYSTDQLLETMEGETALSGDYCHEIKRKLSPEQLAERQERPQRERRKQRKVPHKLINLISIDPQTGEMWRKYRTGRRLCVNTDPRGFRFVLYQGKRYNAALVAYTYHTGINPTCLIEQVERNDDYSMHNLQAIIGVPGHKKSTMIALDDGEGNHSIPMKWGSYEPSRYDKFHASKKTIDELEKAADEILRDGGGFAPHGILPPALR